MANLKDTNFRMAKLEGAELEEAKLKGVQHLLFDQLSKIKTLYKAELDEELLIPLKKKYPALFKVHDPQDLKDQE